MKRNKTLRWVQRAAALILVMANVISVTSAAFAFDMASSRSYVLCAARKDSGKIIPCTDADLDTRGTVSYGASPKSFIDAAKDEIHLKKVGQNSQGRWWALVDYPVGGGKRVDAYIPLDEITLNNGPHTLAVSSGRFHCARREDENISSSYYVDTGDTTFLVSIGEEKVQLMYNISGGKWRLAWAEKADYEKYVGSLPGSNTTGLEDVTASFAGKTVVIRSVENGKYIGLDLVGSLKANKADRDERVCIFEVSPLTREGCVGLKAANGNFVSSEQTRINAPMVAWYGNLLTWEAMKIYRDANGNHYIRMEINGKFLCVRMDVPGAPVEAFVDKAQTWERLNIIVCGEDAGTAGATLVDPDANLSVKNRSRENGIMYANSPGQRGVQALIQVVGQYDVEHNARYQRTSKATFCNIYVWDILRAMGAEIPHWVLNNAPATSNTRGARELNANATYNWLRDCGAQYGWTVVSAADAQKRANAGYPAVAVWKNPNPSRSGHIAIVMPEGDGWYYSSSRGPVITQAGAKNYDRCSASTGFGSSRLSAIVYYTHA